MIKSSKRIVCMLLGLGCMFCITSCRDRVEENRINLDNEVEINEVCSNQVEEEEMKEMFFQYEEKAKQILENMSLEEKVGQMFLVRYPGSGVYEQIREEMPGGYILFGKDLKGKTKQEIQEELESCQKVSKIPLIMGVDEEGGTVVRVSSNPALREKPFASPQKLYKEGGMERIQEDTKEKSELLLQLGFNLSLAPVADVSINPEDFIYQRSFGKGAKETGEFVKQVVEVMKEIGISSALKHFPGYGNNVDTHTGVAMDERAYITFETSDFIPFQAGIEAGVPVILVAHNVVKCMDENLPASLS